MIDSLWVTSEMTSKYTQNAQDVGDGGGVLAINVPAEEVMLHQHVLHSLFQRPLLLLLENERDVVSVYLKRQTWHHRGQLHYIGPLTKHQSAVSEGSVFYLTANERKTCWHHRLGSGQGRSQYSTHRGQFSNVICPFTTTGTGTSITLLNGSTKTQKDQALSTKMTWSDEWGKGRELD